MEQWFSCHAQPNFEIQITVYKSMKQNEVSFSLTNYTSWDPEEHILPSYSDNAVEKAFRLPLFADPASEASEYVNAPLRTSPYANFDPDTLRSWISTCQKNHIHCRKTSHVVLPSRVIDVSNAKVDGFVFLYIPTTGERGAYAALSYCWGDGERPVLRTDTLNTFVQGLRISDLPKTYIDAIELTQQLGLQYLWIDALCILQDDSTDKLLELPRMHRYYRDALFAISATHAAHVKDGFLSRTKDIPVTYDLPRLGVKQSRTQEIPITSPNGRHETAFLMAESHPYASIGGPITTRAWTLQEHVLPEILIQFPSPEEFVFSCTTEQEQNEVFPHSSVENTGNMRRLLLEVTGGDVPILLQIRSRISTPAERMHKNWNNMVSNYGRRHLKEHGDRLIAISALAEEYSLSLPDVAGEYRAGLWEKFLPHSLIWVVHETGIREAPNPVVSPTWSWAAVFGAGYPLQFSQRLSTAPLISVLSCETILSEPTLPFGSVRQGTLKVKGRAYLTDTWKTELDGKTYLYGEVDFEGQNRCVVNLDCINNKIYIGCPVIILPVFPVPVRFAHEAMRPPKYTCLLLKLGEDNTCFRIGIVTSFYIHKATYEAWNERVFRIV